MKWKDNGKINPLETETLLYEACLDYFSKYSYNEVSLNKILQQANINKGSFYNRFSSKMDLYLSLIEYIGQLKMALFAKIDQTTLTLRDLLLQQLQVAIAFAKTDPRLSDITYRISIENKDVLTHVNDYFGQSTEDSFRLFIQQSMDCGELRADINAKTLSNFLQQTLTSASQYISLNQDEATINQQYQQVIDIIYNGIAGGTYDKNQSFN